MYSMVLATNALSCSARPSLALAMSVATVCAVWTLPLAATASPDIQGVAVQPDGLALADLVEHLGADIIDQRDARLDQQLRAEIGVPAADAGGRVDHGRHLQADQRLGADPVQVSVVDDGDLARLQAPGQVLGPVIKASEAAHPRQVP